MLIRFKFNKMYIVGFAITLALFCTCTAKPSVTVTEDQSGSRVEINAGDILAVKLQAQLGTGYAWKIISKSSELEQLGEPKQSPVKSSGKGEKPGGSEYQTFLFKAVEKGETELKMQYVEGWLKKATVKKEFSIIVVIK